MFLFFFVKQCFWLLNFDFSDALTLVTVTKIVLLSPQHSDATIVLLRHCPMNDSVDNQNLKSRFCDNETLVNDVSSLLKVPDEKSHHPESCGINLEEDSEPNV